MPSSTPLKGLLIHVHLNRLIYCNAVMEAPMTKMSQLQDKLWWEQTLFYKILQIYKKKKLISKKKFIFARKRKRDRSYLARLVAWTTFRSNASITNFPMNSLSSSDSVAFRTDTGPRLRSSVGWTCPSFCPIGNGCCVVIGVKSMLYRCDQL